MSCRLEEAIKDIEILAAKPGAAKIAKELMKIADGAKDKLRILDSINIQKQQNDDREYDSEVADKLADKLQKLYGNIEVMYLNGQKEMRQVLEELSGGLAMFQLSNKRKQEFEDKLRKARPDLSKTSTDTIIKSIEEFSEKEAGKDEKLMKKLELLALHWTLKGNVILPEDAEKIMQALKIADKNKVDPFAYTSPDVLMDAFEKIKEKEGLLDPDTLLEEGFTNKLDIGRGIVLYDVDNDETGRAASRKIMDSHYSETKNPWCLLVRDENGLTEGSEEMWYDQYPGEKRIAFQDGKLISFYGGNQWWDIQGTGMRKGVPITIRGKFIPFENRVRQVVTVSETDATEILQTHGYELGLDKKGHRYKKWDDNKIPILEKLADGSKKWYYKNGKIKWEVLSDNTEKHYYESGELEVETLYGRSEKQYYRSGQLKYEKITNKGEKHYYEDGQLKYEKLPDGSEKQYYEDGQLEIEKLPDGSEKRWYEDRQLKYEKLPDGSEKQYYRSGQLKYEKLPDGSEKQYEDKPIVVINKERYENGKTKSKKFSDGSENIYYENGQLKYEKLVDGSITKWDEDGQLRYKVSAEGDIEGVKLSFQKQDDIIKGAALLDKNKILIDIENRSTDTLTHEYAHFYVASFRDTPIVQEAIKKWGGEEQLVQAIGEQTVKQKGEVYEWWKKFSSWLKSIFENLSKVDKEDLVKILTDAFLTNMDLNKVETIKQQVNDDTILAKVDQKELIKLTAEQIELIKANILNCK